MKSTLLAVCTAIALPIIGIAETDKPNILIIWGDDVGWFNTSAYNRGMMGYRTPNIDRIADEGVHFQQRLKSDEARNAFMAFMQKKAR